MYTKILLDSGDQAETRSIKDLLGFLDGQTTNPSLFSKNPEVAARIAAGDKLSREEDREGYKKIVQEISPLVGEAGVSIEVYSDLRTTAEQMFTEGQDMFTWIPNAYIKYPCTVEGLKAAQLSVASGMRVNLTLCFSQEQAAAVYAATKGADSAFVSPFVGRLDDQGKNGISLIENILKMYKAGDGHVKVLAASIRSLEHMLACLALKVDMITLPANVIEAWVEAGRPEPGIEYLEQYTSKLNLEVIPYEEISLDKELEEYKVGHELTEKGILKFVSDFNSTLK
jgi:transaldolase